MKVKVKVEEWVSLSTKEGNGGMRLVPACLCSAYTYIPLAHIWLYNLIAQCNSYKVSYQRTEKRTNVFGEHFLFSAKLSLKT